MADLEGNILQQASVDYLSQINRNVVALNSTAIAQKDIQERQLTTQEATAGVLREAKDGVGTNVQNQAYMAYGTFQHDMKGMMGVTDQNTRIAMSTAHIGGSRFVGDVMGAGQVVAGGAVGASAVALNKIAGVMAPGSTVNQGLLGASANLLGLTMGSTAYTAEEWETLGKRQVGTLGERFVNKLKPFSSAGDIYTSGMQYEQFNYRFGAKGPFMSANDIDEIGRTAVNVRGELKARGYGQKEAEAVMAIGRQSEFDTVETGDIAKLRENIKKFAIYTADLSKEFHVAAEDMATALKDIRAKTGMSLDRSKEFLEKTNLRAQSLGYTPEEAIAVGANAINVSSALGYMTERGSKEYLNVLSEVRRRAAGNEEYLESIGGEEGIGGRAQTLMAGRSAFSKSSMGLIYSGAMNKGFDLTGGSLADLGMKAAQNFSGGYDAFLLAKYKQIKGEDMDKMGIVMGKWIKDQFKIMYPDAKEEDLKKTGKYSKQFYAFVGMKEGNLDEKATQALYDEYTGAAAQRIDEGAITGKLSATRAELAKEDTSFIGLLKAFKRDIYQSDEAPIAPSKHGSTTTTSQPVGRSAVEQSHTPPPVPPPESTTPSKTKAPGEQTSSDGSDAKTLSKLEDLTKKLEMIAAVQSSNVSTGTAESRMG